MLAPRHLLAPLLGLVVGSTASSAGAANYNDAISDFSGSNNAPTSITLDVGANQINGTIGTSPNDLDFFTFTLPPGRRLASVILTANSSSTSFIGVAAGTFFPSTDMGSSTGPLGWEHFHEGYLNTNILDDMGLQGKKFTPPLGPGSYTFWIQETSNPIKSYGFNFVVESLGPPASVPAVPFVYSVLLFAGLLTAGAVGLQAARQSRVRSSTSPSPSAVEPAQAPV